MITKLILARFVVFRIAMRPDRRRRRGRIGDDYQALFRKVVSDGPTDGYIIWVICLRAPSFDHTHWFL